MALKTPQEIELMREGGRILASTLDALAAAVKPGIKTWDLEILAREHISKAGARPSFLNYNGFPAALCVSINEEIVHGLPSERKIKEGDLIKLDLGVFYKGFHTDSARSVVAGVQPHSEHRTLISVAEEALRIGIESAQPGKRTGDIGHAIHQYVKSQGYDVPRELIGHGVGKTLHEKPEVPNYGKPGTGSKLEPGLTIAIEPMVMIGDWHITEGPDGYSYVSVDGKPVAHAEHTVAITENGPVILTE